MNAKYVLISASLAVLVGCQTAQWEKPAAIPREEGLFRCQIHRGGGAKAKPDNSLETFLWCWGHGMAPEADARLTKDGVAIAMHDDNFKRIGRGISPDFATKKIKDLTWDEIKDIDTGSYLGSEYASTRIATMESVFAAMKGRPERLLYVDEKGAPPELIAKLANRFGVIEQVYYTSSNWRLIPRWRKIAPKGRSMVWLGNFPRDNSPENVAKTEAFVQKRLDEMAATGFNGIDQVQIHVRTDLKRDDPFCPSTPFLKRAVELLHKYGVSAQTVTWTEGTNKDVYRKLWDLGFDHFTTDYPETLFEVADGIRSGSFK
ncbi:MAG: glycerophosphodiester phosphodiesterase family protein [Kiritimatiellae bacterium]|nr:glycerophosphodiester phosphodiesterase family protein [Kiritimatiellia bacterium]